jgi:nitroreductase
MRSRSAGNDRSGLAPLLTPLPAGSRDALLALWRDLGARRGALAGEAELEPLLLWLDESDGPASLHDLHGRPRALPVGARPRELLRDALPNVRARHNVAALKCHAMWCADLPAATARHGAAALRRLHLAAGAQAQDLCLAAAALGLFARPVRMLREEVLEGGLGLPGPLAYQVMCGLNRSTNTHWSL